jgi:hypothetical protein
VSVVAVWGSRSRMVGPIVPRASRPATVRGAGLTVA